MNRAMVLAALAAATLLMTAKLQAQPPTPKPGPEHEHLKQMEGTWDATVEFGGSESKGVMTYKMDLGGLWLFAKFEADFGGMKFQGRGADGYDPARKKYLSLWVDSMSTAPLVSEGTYDKDTNTLTMTGEGPGPDGKPAKMKMVTQYKDADHMTFTLTHPDGGQPPMTIKYTRRK